MKILVLIEDDLFYRNFIKSGAFDDLRKKHDVCFAYAHNPGALKNTVSSGIDIEGLNIIARFEYPPKRAKRIYNFIVLSMVKLRHKSPTFMTRYKYQLSAGKRVLYRVLSSPVFYNAYKSIFMKSIGIYGPIDAIINDASPDLVVIPTALIDSISVDAIQSSKKLRVKTLMLINSWDNLSSKGTIPSMPDYVGVWGEQCRGHAIEIHNLPPDRVRALGAAQFQPLYAAHNADRAAFRNSCNLPAQKRIILFAGSARVFDETSILADLEKAIERGDLKDVHILYRPHPWRHKRTGEDSFFQHSFKHITLDPSLADSYRRHKEDRSFTNLPSTVMPDLGYYPKLYSAIDAVICTLTTIMVEAAICGIPSLVIAFGDDKHKLTMDKLIHDKHFEAIASMTGIIVSKDREGLIAGANKLILLSEDSSVRNLLKESIKHIAYSDQKTYGERLSDFIDSIAGTES
jgi:hypothetical protein